MMYWLLVAVVVALLLALVSCRKPSPVALDGANANSPADSVITAADGRAFMEHPSDKEEAAVDAMADGIARLRQLPAWDRWITFTAQGQGGREDSYHFADLKVFGDRVDSGDVVLDCDKAMQTAGLDKSGLHVSRLPEGHVVLRGSFHVRSHSSWTRSSVGRWGSGRTKGREATTQLVPSGECAIEADDAGRHARSRRAAGSRERVPRTRLTAPVHRRCPKTGLQ